MRAENPLHHGGVGPDGRHELGLADDPAGVLHELDEHVERAATDLHGLAAPLQKPLGNEELEGPECRGNTPLPVLEARSPAPTDMFPSLD